MNKAIFNTYQQTFNKEICNILLRGMCSYCAYLVSNGLTNKRMNESWCEVFSKYYFILNLWLLCLLYCFSLRSIVRSFVILHIQQLIFGWLNQICMQNININGSFRMFKYNKRNWTFLNIKYHEHFWFYFFLASKLVIWHMVW